MSAVFCKPKKITFEASGTLTAGHPKNLTNDEPGMVWRSSGLTNVYSVFKMDGTAIDTIALIDNNLRPTDTVRVRMGATVAELNGVSAFDETYQAWSGIAPIGNPNSVFMLDAPVTHDYIRIDVYSTGNPDGHVEVCRLVVGSRLIHDGIDIGHEEVFDDTSSVEEGPGYTTIDSYNIRQTHKIAISGVKEEVYYSEWRPFLASVGMSKFFLYMEADSGPYVQHKTEPPRDCRRPFGLSYAAKETSSSMA